MASNRSIVSATELAARISDWVNRVGVRFISRYLPAEVALGISNLLGRVFCAHFDWLRFRINYLFAISFAAPWDFLFYNRSFSGVCSAPGSRDFFLNEQVLYKNWSQVFTVMIWMKAKILDFGWDVSFHVKLGAKAEQILRSSEHMSVVLERLHVNQGHRDVAKRTNRPNNFGEDPSVGIRYKGSLRPTYIARQAVARDWLASGGKSLLSEFIDSKSKDIEAQKEQLGLATAPWYCVVHLRDDGYKGTDSQSVHLDSIRNVKKLAYTSALEFVLDNDGWIVLLGRNMEPPPKLWQQYGRKVVNYSDFKGQSFQLEISLIREALFGIATCSGVVLLMEELQIPIAYTNSWPVTEMITTPSASSTIHKHLYLAENNRRVKLAEILGTSLAHEMDSRVLLKNGYIWKDNTPGEILDNVSSVFTGIKSTSFVKGRIEQELESTAHDLYQRYGYTLEGRLGFEYLSRAL